VQRFRKLLTATLVVVMAWTAAFQPAVANAPLQLGGAIAVSCDDACDDCNRDGNDNNACGTPAACAASCIRLPGQPPAQLEVPLVHLVVQADVGDRPTHAVDFASHVIRPLLPPPRD